MRKIKGVKVYPVELQMYLAGVPNMDPENIRLRVSRPEGTTDRLSITIAGDAKTVDKEAVESGLNSVMGISVDELVMEEGFEVPDDEVIVDER
jgi:phenylacetate-CoA ligase